MEQKGLKYKSQYLFALLIHIYHIINANLNNVFNSTYWNWSGVQGSVASVSSPTYNATAAQQSATAAPRNAQVSVRYDF
jgi:hemoglobin/transferrin/lactoferrin receptor protein